jgi:hypothetical protein
MKREHPANDVLTFRQRFMLDRFCRALLNLDLAVVAAGEGSVPPLPYEPSGLVVVRRRLAELRGAARALLCCAGIEGPAASALAYVQQFEALGENILFGCQVIAAGDDRPEVSAFVEACHTILAGDD